MPKASHSAASPSLLSIRFLAEKESHPTPQTIGRKTITRLSRKSSQSPQSLTAIHPKLRKAVVLLWDRESSFRNPATLDLTTKETPMSDEQPAGQQPEPTPSRKGIGGPRAPEGRRRASLNACRTLITSKIHLCSPEEQPAFDAHMAAYKEALAPVGILETELVAEISKMKWRLKRASSAEDSIFSQAHLDYADDMQSGHPAVDSCLVEGKVWKEQAHNLILIPLYETRMRRAVEKDMAALQALQEKRKASYARAQAEAIRLMELAESQNEDYVSWGGFPARLRARAVRFFASRPAPRNRPRCPPQPFLGRQQAPPDVPESCLTNANLTENLTNGQAELKTHA